MYLTGGILLCCNSDSIVNNRVSDPNLLSHYLKNPAQALYRILLIHYIKYMIPLSRKLQDDTRALYVVTSRDFLFVIVKEQHGICSRKTKSRNSSFKKQYRVTYYIYSYN